MRGMGCGVSSMRRGRVGGLMLLLVLFGYQLFEEGNGERKREGRGGVWQKRYH
jgi:hypothetical protein